MIVTDAAKWYRSKSGVIENHDHFNILQKYIQLKSIILKIDQ